MAKFYVYDNATRRLKSGKFIFSFDVIEQFGGNWRGVLKLEDPDAITALETFNKRLGVNEITEAEYDALLKKKVNSLPPSPSTVLLLTPPLKGAGAVVLKEPSDPITPKVVVTKPEVSEAITIGTAPYVDPLEQRTDSKRRKRSA